MDEVDLVSLGARIRSLRTERGLSLSALAVAANIGKGSLSELESGRRNPTLATLYALANVLGMPLGAMLAERPGSQLSGDGLTVSLLGSDHLVDDRGPGRVVGVYRLAFDTGADRRSGAEPPGTVEHLLVTSGRLEVTHRRRTDIVSTGESLTFGSDVPHRYRPLDDAPCTAVLVITSLG